MQYVFLSQVHSYILLHTYSYFNMEEKLYKDGKQTWFYTNCKRQRKAGAKICQECPFRKDIENFEKTLGKL